ncbi:hypothetical protein U1Q18_009621, partial [Sarracenia purpurea var. burkii]
MLNFGSKLIDTKFFEGDEEEDDEDEEDEEFGDEASYGKPCKNKHGSNKLKKSKKQMIPNMFLDKNDAYLSSD